MRRWMILALGCAFAGGSLPRAGAQRGELEVTMRVLLDDASGVDAVLIPIDPPPAAEAGAPDVRETPTEAEDGANEGRAPAGDREPAEPEDSAEERAQ